MQLTNKAHYRLDHDHIPATKKECVKLRFIFHLRMYRSGTTLLLIFLEINNNKYTYRALRLY